MDTKQINWWRRRLYISANNKQKSSDPYEFSTTPASKETKQFKTGGGFRQGRGRGYSACVGESRVQSVDVGRSEYWRLFVEGNFEQKFIENY
jgi:hypothetical protein